jgi:hypothetical protein
MKSLHKLSYLSLAALTMTAQVKATESETQSSFTIKPIVEMGLAFGGDDVGTLEYENGDSIDVTSGGGAFFGGGFDVGFNGKPYGVLLTASYQGDSASASNAEVSFDRFVMNAMPYIRVNDKIAFSAGVTFHNSVEYEMDYYGTETAEFDSASGLVAEIRYLASEQWIVSGRATLIDYSISKFNGYDVSSYAEETLSGNNLGIFVTYAFSK